MYYLPYYGFVDFCKILIPKNSKLRNKIKKLLTKQKNV